MKFSDMLLQHNRKWVASKLAADPQYFAHLRDGQTPRVLYIGCSDSRVPPEAILGADLGEVFVDRNIGNLVKREDPGLMSVLEYGVLHLQVEHVIVCGHYGCGAVSTALSRDPVESNLDSWIREIRDLWQRSRALLEGMASESYRQRALEVLNVLQQSTELEALDLIRETRARTGRPRVHAWIFHIPDGKIINLGHLVDLAQPLAVDESLLGRIAELHAFLA